MRRCGWLFNPFPFRSRMMHGSGLKLVVAVVLVSHLWAVEVSAQMPKPGASRIVRVATLNCEFLSSKKVHIKFGLPFNLTAPGDVATWNAAGFRAAKLKEASIAIAKQIVKLKADVIGLTEVGTHADVQILQQELKVLGMDYPHLAVCKSSDGTTGQHVAVLSMHPFVRIYPTIPGREGYFEELDDPESESSTGISKGMQVTFDVRGRTVNLFVIHLASERNGHEQDAQRIAQASIVRRTCLKALNEDEHVIVMGDFNDHRGQPALLRIRGLDDIFEDLIQTGGPVFNRRKKAESNADYNQRVGDHWSYEFSGQRNQIDHILISQSIRDDCVSSSIVPEFVTVDEKIGGTAHLASDHRAVVLQMKLR